MKIEMESTSRIVECATDSDGFLRARLWEGTTESGIPVELLVVRVAVRNTEDCSQFEAELQEQREPKLSSQAFDMRLIL